MKKFCPSCGRFRPRTEFQVSRRSLDGLQGRCRDCQNSRVSAYQRTDRGRANCVQRVKRYQASERGKTVLGAYMRSEAYSATRAVLDAHAKQRFPERIAARKLVYWAVKTGILSKQPCKVCGSFEVEAHHDDYSRPLEIEWFCHQHHVTVAHNGRFRSVQVPAQRRK